MRVRSTAPKLTFEPSRAFVNAKIASFFDFSVVFSGFYRFFSLKTLRKREKWLKRQISGPVERLEPGSIGGGAFVANAALDGLIERVDQRRHAAKSGEHVAQERGLERDVGGQ